MRDILQVLCTQDQNLNSTFVKDLCQREAQRNVKYTTLPNRLKLQDVINKESGEKNNPLVLSGKEWATGLSNIENDIDRPRGFSRNFCV